LNVPFSAAYTGAADQLQIGMGWINRGGVAFEIFSVVLVSATQAEMYYKVGVVITAVTTTTPVALAAGDAMVIDINYEASTS
jgi:hypothetical protein